MRSLVSLLAPAFTAEQGRFWKTELGILARPTNALRDLDVHLLDRTALVTRVPPTLREGLEPIFEELAGRRAQEQAAVAKWLRSAAYRRRRRKLEAMLCDFQAMSKGPDGATAISALVGRTLLQRHKKLAAKSRNLSAESPDESIHEIRIRCKKLRYLIDPFRSLFTKSQLGSTVRDLKRLQEHLGAFNDRAVQQGMLLQHAERHPEDPRTSLSVGALAGVLYGEYVQHRAACIDSLAEFTGKAKSRAFRLAISGEAGGNTGST
jgi:CHAD domain-containing protein